MTDFGSVGILSIVWMIMGVLIFVAAPVALAIFWLVKKKERITTVLLGAVAFVLFALIIEKLIQNALLFPSVLGLPNHVISTFFNAHPVILAFLVGLFPGVFEETGRLIVFKTVLRKRTNKETSISYGIGHGGIEVALLLGITYVNYIAYAIAINTGAFTAIVDQVLAQAPDQIAQVEQTVSLLTTFSFGKLLLDVVERIFAVSFHIGASILVFYACKDKKKFWLYLLAIAIHTAMDFTAGLVIFNVISIPAWGLELIVAIIGIGTLLGAYLLLYRKDKNTTA